MNNTKIQQNQLQQKVKELADLEYQCEFLGISQEEFWDIYVWDKFKTKPNLDLTWDKSEETIK